MVSVVVGVEDRSLLREGKSFSPSHLLISVSSSVFSTVVKNILLVIHHICE